MKIQQNPDLTEERARHLIEVLEYNPDGFRSYERIPRKVKKLRDKTREWFLYRGTIFMVKT